MLGALGLLGSLAALGKEINDSRSSRLPLAKIKKRLPEPAQAELKELLAMKRESVKAAKDTADAALQLFLTEHGLGGEPNISAERSLVKEFILGKTERIIDPSTNSYISSDGRVLTVDGQPVAYRESRGFAKFVKVCPGDFGTKKAHRRVANALLSVLGAGLAFRDRDARVFIAPSRGRTGRLVAPVVGSGSSAAACYLVEIDKKMREAVNESVAEEQITAQTIRDEEAAMWASRGVSGLRRRHRRSRR